MYSSYQFVTNCAVDKHTKISVEVCILTDIQKVKYQWTNILVFLNTGTKFFHLLI